MSLRDNFDKRSEKALVRKLVHPTGRIDQLSSPKLLAIDQRSIPIGMGDFLASHQLLAEQPLEGRAYGVWSDAPTLPDGRMGLEDIRGTGAPEVIESGELEVTETGKSIPFGCHARNVRGQCPTVNRSFRRLDGVSGPYLALDCARNATRFGAPPTLTFQIEAICPSGVTSTPWWVTSRGAESSPGGGRRRPASTSWSQFYESTHWIKTPNSALTPNVTIIPVLNRNRATNAPAVNANAATLTVAKAGTRS